LSFTEGKQRILGCNILDFLILCIKDGKVKFNQGEEEYLEVL